MLVPINDGPMAGCNVRQNGNCVDPNIQPGRSAGGSTFMTIPKEIHTPVSYTHLDVYKRQRLIR